jgi:hypothetical protein
MNVLVVGDSISSIDFSGLGDQLQHHYVRQLELNNHNVTNLSLGGQSNQKIIYKTCLELTKNTNYYNLVIVQWSALFRINLNKGDTVYEDVCNFGVSGVDTYLNQYKSFWDTWTTHFIHPRTEILTWMTQIILLDNFLVNQRIPYVFIKGFDNFFKDLDIKNWKETSNTFKSIVLHSDKHPDEELDSVYDELISMYNQVCAQANWLNLFSDPWHEGRTDIAADGIHPGPLSHTNYYNNLDNYIKKLGLSF